MRPGHDSAAFTQACFSVFAQLGTVKLPDVTEYHRELRIIVKDRGLTCQFIWLPKIIGVKK